MKTYISRYWILIISVILGFGLRYWASMTQPIFSDEAFSIYEARFWDFPYDPSYPPGYPLLLKLWTGASTNLFWARLPSVLAGTLSLIIFWQTLKKHVNLRSANLGVFLLATSSLHLHYTWVARPGGITALITVLSLSQLLGLADSLKSKVRLNPLPLILYLATNTLGAFVCHGFTLFLAGSLTALIIWIFRVGAWRETIRNNKTGIGILATHILLPIMQYAFVHARISPLVDSADWIPDFNFYSITSAFLTLFNGAKTLTSEMWTAAPITIFFSLIGIIIICRMLWATLYKRVMFLGILFVTVIVASLLGTMAVHTIFDMNILQPRLLMGIHIMYITGLSITLPSFFRITPKSQAVRLLHTYELMFIAVLLGFWVRSLFLLNIFPYYNDQYAIHIVQSMKNDTQSTVLVFPRYQILTVKYLWGLDNPYPTSLLVADKSNRLPQNATAEAFRALMPEGTPIKIIRWPSDATLSSGAQEFVNQLAPFCQKQQYRNIDILDCPSLPQQH